MYRVLHSVSFLRRAGIETMLMNYYKHIDKKRIQFDFLVNSEIVGEYEKDAIDLGARIFRSPGYQPYKYHKFRQFMDTLFRKNPEIKIVHGHNGALSFFPLFAAMKSGVPIRIAHSHNTNINFDAKWFIKKFCKSRLTKTANIFFACSELAASFYFGSDIVKEKNYTLIRNAIELEKFTYNISVRNNIRKSNGWENKLIIGHVGRFMHQKNHSYLIDIFKKLNNKNPNSILILIGDGELKNRIQEKAFALGLSDKIYFLGSISNVNEYYQAMDALVMPSWYEGLPVVGIEAQASGLPCIFSDTITLEAKITDSTEFYSLKKPPERWAELILKTVNGYVRRDVAEEMKFGGYDIKIEAKRLEDIYIKLAKNSCNNRIN